ncbi:HAMP domain-containing sensor histidine kinase [Ruminococcus sp. Marseille-P6503]|uniref:sensor histidine kinase n=1 Tax=Ruminococcus sp. Marseille-P6503 TaxID=2364796 RepID=UPI000F51ECA8|nr:HAMP domain-containing sensor histidine kinase [Ruminococcus sp. Marseille-P6503]
MRFKKRPFKWQIRLLFTLMIFFILVVTMIIVGISAYILYQAGVIPPLMRERGFFPLTLLVFILASIAVSTIISLFFSRLPLRPVHTLVEGMSQLAQGNYKERIDLGDTRLGQNLSESFNLLAEELENTEMLRSDFVNGFSHEFKTPIVSILGFAKLLSRGNVPAQQQKEYLKIIEEESSRLAAMATNVLNMTKIENQNILTDVERYNLSEQLRTCVLLLEKKWSRKNLQITADFEEYEISGNEELLKQIWINLLDNAVKFTPEQGEISIGIQKHQDCLTVEISNTGSEISPEDQARIFQKFYQGDGSRATEGNGLGLSIALKIAELHNGSIGVSSRPGKTVFTVKLPVNMPR